MSKYDRAERAATRAGQRARGRSVDWIVMRGSKNLAKWGEASVFYYLAYWGAAVCKARIAQLGDC